MEDIGKYIGITHKYAGADFDKCDCFGLVQLFYKEHGWSQSFDDGKPYPTEDEYAQPKYWRRLYEYLLRNFTEVDYKDLSFGDVVVFEINGCIHLGIYLEYGKLLAMEVPAVEGESKSTIYHRGMWTQCFKYGFRRNDA
ncbi:hypothetical protein SELR_pSRC300180 (plasmid) [Selenomonas ruminantium subsp. lactilytica TAM6421]|uniref:NlpC/P60 domain-containing protein n=1 Tax=Selenomonas ruminantium subsp. lactilytica (strain NBRC 103574 / TAM6421) TaxID=927704 RepID=I0GWF4_SELRL|nr:NlpC/P60 family protein [Selenomonas ruminantium]BAL85091.1 hypothetical protein SELR_pSRC300180 [Selenomonas ruminantium subsp. lactilytica TAM6421]